MKYLYRLISFIFICFGIYIAQPAFLIVMFFGYIIWNLDYPSSEEIHEHTDGFHQVKVKEHWSKFADSNGRRDWMIDYYETPIDYLLKRNMHSVNGEQ